MILRGNTQGLQYKTKRSSGFDLPSAVEMTIQSMEFAIVQTGIYIEHARENQELQIRSRSGLAYKHGIFVLNGIGTIDADYDGEIGVILMNIGKLPFKIEVGDRIAQAVLARVEKVEDIKIKETRRGTGGFGSTGVR